MIKHKAVATVGCLLLAGACSSKSHETGSDGGHDAGKTPAVTCTNGTMTASDASNYAFSSTMTLPSVTVKSMSNLAFDWSQVTKDFLGQPVSATADLNTVLVMLWSLPPSEFEAQLVTDTLNTSALVTSPPPSIAPAGGATSAMLYDFKVNGYGVSADEFNMQLDPTANPPATSTFLVAAQTGTNLGQGIRMLQAFEVDNSSTNTKVNLTNSSAVLNYTANLHDLNPMGVPAGTAALTLDFGQLSKNALGIDFDPTQITSAVVGHYTQSVSQIETDFLDLRTLASDLYTTTIPSGTVLDFTTLMDSSGKPFPGIDSTGTWLVGLICGNCRNPAPWYLTLLEPAAQPCGSD